MMDESLRALVRQRAENRCEYCRIHQDDEPYFRFHVDHIIPQQHGGAKTESNLALCCHFCNKRKGPNLASIDPVTGQIAVLFNPRSDSWADHFRSSGVAIVGLTPTG